MVMHSLTVAKYQQIFIQSDCISFTFPVDQCESYCCTFCQTFSVNIVVLDITKRIVLGLDVSGRPLRKITWFLQMETIH